MRGRSLLLILALVGTTHAKSLVDEARPVEPYPALRIGAPGAHLTIAKLRVALDQEPHVLTAKLTFTITCDDYEGREAVIALALPGGARLTRAALTLGHAERMEASAITSASASEQYRENFERKRDPLLVQHTRDLRAGSELELRAFPLTETDHGRLEITLELPPTTKLRIDPAGQTIGVLEVVTASKRRERHGVDQPVAIVTPSAHAVTTRASAVTGVTAKTSLYAGPPPSRGGPREVVDHEPVRAYGTVDNRVIRRKFREHRNQFRYCYERVVQFRGGNQGEAVLHLTIGKSGRVIAASVDGELEEPTVASCLAEIARGWTFYPGETTVLVNYPVRFVLATY